jgi:hypothetical protein
MLDSLGLNFCLFLAEYVGEEVRASKQFRTLGKCWARKLSFS